MKTLLLASFCSLSALACPSLQGQYKSCHAVEGAFSDSVDFSVVQRFDGTDYTFHISSVDPLTDDRTIDTYKADGKLYEQELVDLDTGAYLTYSTLTSCTETELKIITKIYGDELTVLMSKVGKKIIQKISGKNLNQTINAIVECE